jgi:hypothetical protein
MITMPHRTPCTWRQLPHSENVSQICSICYGHVNVNGADVCPFLEKYKIDPTIQHLITAEERFYSISQLRKLEELKQG